MKKIKKFLLIIFAFTILCCTTNSGIYFNDKLSNDPINGTVELVSMQMERNPVTFSATWGNSTTTTKILFDNANYFAMSLFEFMDNSIWSKIILNNSINNESKLSNVVKGHSVPADGFFLVTDEYENPYQMDQDILIKIKSRSNADFFLVFDVDVQRYSQGGFLWNTKISDIEFEFSVVIYNKYGEKNVSKHYKHRIKKTLGNPTDPDIIASWFLEATKSVSLEMSNDLRGILKNVNFIESKNNNPTEVNI